MAAVDRYEAFWESSLDELDRHLPDLDSATGEVGWHDRHSSWRRFERRATADREAEPAVSSPVAPSTTPADGRRARRDLLEQIARLESDLASLFTSAYPRSGFDWRVRSRAGPRLLTLAELEELRDDLAERAYEVRRTLSERTRAEEQNRRLIEEMMLEPEKHKWVRVGNADIGERGCKHWHVQPRWGILGILLKWWRVRISSGCPLRPLGAM